MKVRYFDETKRFDFIDNYQQFLEKCYKEFDMSEEEKKSLRISILDDGDEMTVENEGDFNDYKSSLNENNELICILKSSGRTKNNEILEEIKKLKEELIKKIDDEKKINNKSFQEIKTLIYETNENNKKNDEENNQKLVELVKENKNLKSQISELKQFLLIMEENNNNKKMN